VAEQPADPENHPTRRGRGCVHELEPERVKEDRLRM
jgi:hypothetical protein